MSLLCLTEVPVHRRGHLAANPRERAQGTASGHNLHLAAGLTTTQRLLGLVKSDTRTQTHTQHTHTHYTKSKGKRLY